MYIESIFYYYRNPANSNKKLSKTQQDRAFVINSPVVYTHSMVMASWASCCLRVSLSHNPFRADIAGILRKRLVLEEEKGWKWIFIDSETAHT